MDWPRSIVAALSWPRKPRITKMASLNDDYLNLIIDELKRIDPSAIVPLSTMNRQLRALCIPHIFDLRHLTVQLTGNKEEMYYNFYALETSEFAALALHVLLVKHNISSTPGPLDKPVLYNLNVSATLLTNLSKARGIRELHLSNVGILHAITRSALPLLKLENVAVLKLEQVEDAAALIKACSKLNVLRIDFPYRKLGRTSQAICDSPVDCLEIESRTGWRPKDIKQLLEPLLSVSHVYLKGPIKAAATVS
jgi:hypothetical protein